MSSETVARLGGEGLIRGEMSGQRRLLSAHTLVSQPLIALSVERCCVSNYQDVLLAKRLVLGLREKLSEVTALRFAARSLFWLDIASSLPMHLIQHSPRIC
jgi:hypothetical protein